MVDCGFEQGFVAAAEVFELALKAALETAKERLRRFLAMLVAAHDVHHKRGDEGSREQVAGQHGEADRLGQRDKEKLCNAREEEHGHEDDADAEGGNECGDGDLLSAIENCLAHFFAHGEVALDVFDLDSGIVDEDAYGESETSESHDVDGLADRSEKNDGDEDGERDRDRDNDGWTPVAEEDEDHDRSERGGDQTFAQDSVDGGADEKRLVEEAGDFEFGRKGLRGLLHDSFHAGDDVERGGIAVFVDRHQHASVAVVANDVGLRSEGVADVSNVAHVQCGAVEGFHRKVVEFRDGLRSSVHLDAVLELAHLDGAGGQNNVLRVDGVDDVVGLEAKGLELGQVEIDLNLRNLAAVGIGGSRAGNRGQIVAKEVLAEIEELLLSECFAAEPELNNGSSGCAIRNDERGSSAGWEAANAGLANGSDLRDGSLHVGALLEENFDDAQAVHGLGFHVLDVINGGSDAALGVGDDAVGHVLRRHAGIEPDDGDYGNVDVGEDVDGSAQDGDGRQDNDDERHHNKCVGTAKG